MFDGIKRSCVRLVAYLDERICARDDDIATRMGWQITRTGFASRTYRDPRFGQLKVADVQPERRSA
ncbi:hypothetical protein OHA25_04885 [Nonomuraea sp. NBC_00507]|uniref:hypothetical protein n=1 Tax=Nonomuraea sp. NBC_00507 TaxID=2976002 RepID=UPI002E19F4C7